MGIIRRLVLILCALLAAQPAWATCGATGFGSTFGAGATDSVATGYSTGPASTVSLSAWVFINGVSGPPRVFDQTQSGSHSDASLQVASTTSLTYNAGFTTTDGIFTFTASPVSKWHHVCLTYDDSSTSNKPTVYVDGAAATVTVTTTPSGTAVSAAHTLYVGNRSAANRVMDGKLADFAYWNGAVLTGSECVALSKGVSPLRIRPAALSLFLPLCDTGSRQPDWGPSHVAQAVTGTIAQPGNPSDAFPLMEGGK